MKFLLGSRGYVQVFRNRMVIQVPAENRVVVKEAEFSHPRMVIGDFVMAEKLLEAGLKEAYPRKLLQPRPQLIVHPKEVIEGGLTLIEERVLMEFALGAGASQARVWIGPDLSAEEVANFSF